MKITKTSSAGVGNIGLTHVPVKLIFGVTALESVGVVIDPANRTLKRLPAISLK
jgi:hypothetical protein